MRPPFRKYRRIGKLAEMRAYAPGESLAGISVSDEDQPPQSGDMIARNPENHDDQWLVGRDYFAANFEQEPVE